MPFKRVAVCAWHAALGQLTGTPPDPLPEAAPLPATLPEPPAPVALLPEPAPVALLPDPPVPPPLSPEVEMPDPDGFAPVPAFPDPGFVLDGEVEPVVVCDEPVPPLPPGPELLEQPESRRKLASATGVLSLSPMILPYT